MSNEKIENSLKLELLEMLPLFPQESMQNESANAHGQCTSGPPFGGQVQGRKPQKHCHPFYGTPEHATSLILRFKVGCSLLPNALISSAGKEAVHLHLRLRIL